MSDYNASQPVRTENAGDVIARIADATTPAQQLAIDVSGLLGAKLSDGSGNAISSQASGGQQALDVGINVAGVQVDPRAIRALTSADVVTANQGAANTHANAWFTRLTDGTHDSSLTAAGELTVSLTTAIPAGANNIGSVNQGTSPWITSDLADGSVAGGAAGSKSLLAGAQYNTALPSLTNAQQAALQADSSGRLLVGSIASALPAGTNNIGKVSIQDSSGNPFSNTNPLPVTLDTASGSPINNYKVASGIAAAASDNHDYTVTAGKTLLLDQVEASASGMAKMELQIETGVATGVFNSKFVQFGTASDSNMSIRLNNPISVAAGVRVRCIMTNRDKAAEDLYSTICGSES